MTSTNKPDHRDQVNILMVDDQPAKLLSYETILADLGENLIRANSGNEALDYLLRMDIAVVLVDVCMPELDGFELATMIRNHPRFQKTAIILVSGIMVEDSDRLKGYEHGAVDYVSVPIVPEILRAKVAVFSELFRKTQQLQRLNEELEARVAERTREIEAAAALLRHSEERLRLVLTQSGISGWTWDISQDVVTTVRASGDDAGEACPLEAFLASLVPYDRDVVRASLHRSAESGRDYQTEFRILEGGEERWRLGLGTVIRDAQGSPASIAGVHIDITERKRAEEERAMLLKNADAARREAETANRLKDDFLATLSHELRTPLNAITGWSHMLREGMLDEPGRKRAAEAIERNAQRQSKLIGDILDVSRIVAGKLTLNRELVDMRSVVEAAVDTVRPSADERRVAIETRVQSNDSRLLGDPARLQQVVWNLLSNAIKFTPAKGRVVIALRSSPSGVELSVEDEGPGIDAEILPFIFDRFRQGDSSTTRSHSGLGLGLAIVRQLLDMHGGHVQARNRTDRSGAVFTVTLPSVPAALAEPGLGAGSATAPQGPSLQGVRLLVVDDDLDGREVVAAALAIYGAEVMTADGVPAAMQILKRTLPTVIVADIEMPGEDGYSFVRRLRSLAPDAGGRIPAIALTAHAAGHDRTRILGAGFDVHMPKPVQLLELANTVAKLAAGAPAATPS